MSESQNKYIKETALEICEIEGLECWIVPSPSILCGGGGYNGYAVFPEKPIKESGYDGIAVYVPVHGGITYAEHDELGSVYGFDTLHCDSDKFPRTDPKWIKGQIAVMIRGLRLAAELEDAYLLADGDNDKRAEICDKLCALQRDQMNNFGVNIRLLTGNL